MRLVFVALLAAQALSCLPGAAAPERPACADERLAEILLECQAEIAASPSATEKSRLRAACLERVNAWEACQ